MHTQGRASFAHDEETSPPMRRSPAPIEIPSSSSVAETRVRAYVSTKGEKRMRAQTSHTTRPYALAYFLERENASAHARGSVLGMRVSSRALSRLLLRPCLRATGNLGASEQRRAGPTLPALTGIADSKLVLSGVCMHRVGVRERERDGRGGNERVTGGAGERERERVCVCVCVWRGIACCCHA